MQIQKIGTIQNINFERNPGRAAKARRAAGQKVRELGEALQNAGLGNQIAVVVSEGRVTLNTLGPRGEVMRTFQSKFKPHQTHKLTAQAWKLLRGEI